MINYIFIDWSGSHHTIRASELGAAFQYADEALRQGISFKFYWVEVEVLTYRLALRD